MITKILQTFLSNLSQNNILISYSGGVDSCVLLHVVAQLRQEFPGLKVKAIHIHHGLFAEADQWAAHCQKFCNELKIDLQIIKVEVKCSKGISIEEAARDARYAALAEILQKNDVLITAHHADDQAETCLLQFLRGAGIKGLASMPSIINFSKGFLARPFLKITHAEVLNYAQKNNLSWIEDQSNHDLKFTRNFLRYKIMPEFHKRWPNINKTVLRVADNCAEGLELLRDLAQQDLKKLKSNSENIGETQRFLRREVSGIWIPNQLAGSGMTGVGGSTLSISKIRKLSLVRQKNVLREWIQIQGFRLPSAIKLQHIITDVINARVDATPCVAWQDAEIRSYQGNLYVMQPLVEFDHNTILSWDGKSPLKLPENLGFLRAKKIVGKGLKAEILNKNIEVRFRQGGEQCKLANRDGTHKLKKLFQEWNIPSWQRDRIPLLYINDQFAAIIGYAICQEFVAQNNECGIMVECLV